MKTWGRLLLISVGCLLVASAEHDSFNLSMNNFESFADNAVKLYRNIYKVYNDSCARFSKLNPEMEHLKLDFNEKLNLELASTVTFSLIGTNNELLRLVQRTGSGICSFNANEQLRYANLSKTIQANVDASHALHWRYHDFTTIILRTVNGTAEVVTELDRIKTNTISVSQAMQRLNSGFRTVAERQREELLRNISAMSSDQSLFKGTDFLGQSILSFQSKDELYKKASEITEERINLVESSIKKIDNYTDWLKDQVKELVLQCVADGLDKVHLSAKQDHAKTLKDDIDQQLTVGISPNIEKIKRRLDFAVEDLGKKCNSYLAMAGNISIKTSSDNSYKQEPTTDSPTLNPTTIGDTPKEATTIGGTTATTTISETPTEATTISSTTAPTTIGKAPTEATAIGSTTAPTTATPPQDDLSEDPAIPGHAGPEPEGGPPTE